MLINKRESTGLKYLNDPKVFIEYPNNMDDTYKNIEKYNPCKIKLTVSDDMIANILSNTKFNTIAAELFIRRKN